MFRRMTLAAALTLTAFGPASGGDTTDLKAALDRALDDERHALAFYEAVMAKHGQRRPFANIVRAERRHAAALLAEYERLGLTPPTDRARSFTVPPTFREACDAAEFAEIENVRIYDELLPAVTDERVRDVFRNLRGASQERHLPAFRRHGSGWHVVTAPTPAQTAQAARAQRARETLFATLLGRLGAVVAKDGPAAAIAVCRDEAPRIAAKVGKTEGVRLGRTSWKLRNPANTGPGWLSLVRHERPETPRLLADRTGRLGVVTPIRVAASCLACHGEKESIAPDVRARLGKLYPDDRAIGFKAGDLRGWFWVEVGR